MNIYFEMMKHPVFSIDDLSGYYSNHESARTAIKALVKKGLAVKIRSNMYTCISGETGAPVANRFQIASSIVFKGRNQAELTAIICKDNGDDLGKGKTKSA